MRINTPPRNIEIYSGIFTYLVWDIFGINTGIKFCTIDY